MAKGFFLPSSFVPFPFLGRAARDLTLAARRTNAMPDCQLRGRVLTANSQQPTAN
ncbi:hypothetical protein [Tychonema sp. LEGE 06208]|uniref:hypothetical protein n=1 Tax=Tychonema sp. LEGE 06208 TaxID=1828663 RepID=UPI00187FA77E|nr:hypothetical protein [Tychonema sp. LEGE 06208]MBE9165013.1 hypothetical protein [Tychonema sp. LEGE 06208]